MNLNSPTIYTVKQLINDFNSVQTELPSGEWVPARSDGYWGFCLRLRLKAAWMVFTGRADVVVWQDQ